MIFITGDTHSDFTRFNTKYFPEQKQMTKDDVVIICGDFGGIWYPTENKTEQYWLKWLENKTFTLCFVDGNHENFDRLNQYPIVQKFGESVHQISPSIFHLMRGECYTIQNKRIFTFGGGHSHDISDGILESNDPRIKTWAKDYNKMFRINHISWWKEESPSQQEKAYGMQNINAYKHVDFIITHTPPSGILRQMDYKPDDTSEYLENIRNITNYNKWFCGHIHKNQYFPSQKIQILYKNIIQIV